MVALLFKVTIVFADCSSVDLETPGGALYKIPRHQQTLGTCYAHAVTTLYDAFRQRQSNIQLDKYSSPSDVAFILSQENNNLNGGFISDIIKLNFVAPCPFVARKGFLTNKTIDKNEIQYEKAQNDFKKLAEKTSITNETIKDPHHFQQLQSDSITIKNQYYKIATKRFESAPTQKENFDVIVKNLANQNTNYAFKQQMTSACLPEERLKSTKPIQLDLNLNESSIKIDFINPTNKQVQIMSSLEREFNKPVTQVNPLGLSFCSKVLSAWKKTAYEKNFSDQQKRDYCGPHAVVVSGRRWNSDSKICEYRIRNSWGTCDGLNNHYDCSGRGDTWIPQDLLEKSILGIVTVK